MMRMVNAVLIFFFFIRSPLTSLQHLTYKTHTTISINHSHSITAHTTSHNSHSITSPTTNPLLATLHLSTTNPLTPSLPAVEKQRQLQPFISNQLMEVNTVLAKTPKNIRDYSIRKKYRGVPHLNQSYKTL